MKIFLHKETFLNLSMYFSVYGKTYSIHVASISNAISTKIIATHVDIVAFKNVLPMEWSPKVNMQRSSLINHILFLVLISST